jgi:hypothetical protein
VEGILPAGARVVHQVPGRLRIRFDRGGGRRGWGLAHGLAAHPAVHTVTWNRANHSLVVEHRRETPAAAILAQVAPVDQAPPTSTDDLLRLLGAVVSTLLPLPAQVLLLLLTHGRHSVAAMETGGRG